MLLLGILVWGLFAGWLAHLILYRGTDPEWGRLLIAGLAGSFVGGLIASLIAGDGLELRPSGLIGTVVGAMILLLIDKAVTGPSRLTRYGPGTTGAVAQRSEQRTHNPSCVGSTPAPAPPPPHQRPLSY